MLCCAVVCVGSALDILRQGRCTLVTTLQMYKILALNCLVSAYSLSVLSLQGVKLGDTYATSILFSSLIFFLLSCCCVCVLQASDSGWAGCGDAVPLHLPLQRAPSLRYFTSLHIIVRFVCARLQPLETLSAERPIASIFSPYSLLSIFGQFAAHLATLIYATAMARPFTPLCVSFACLID